MAIASRSVAGSIITSLLFTSLAFAQGTTVPAQGDAARATGEHIKKAEMAGRMVDGECVGKAVEAREDGLIKAHTAHNTAIVAALTARKDALKAGWNLKENVKRVAARNDAHKAFRMARKAANQTMKVSVQDFHRAFNTAVKACGVDYKESAEKASEAASL